MLYHSTVMISFLLYEPQALHTLWGIIRAPHLLHLTSVGAVIFQLARRLSLRDLEDLFLGQMDIENTSFNVIYEMCTADNGLRTAYI